MQGGVSSKLRRKSKLKKYLDQCMNYRILGGKMAV